MKSSFAIYCNNKEKYDEAFLDSMTKSYRTNYNQAQQGTNQNYDKYSDVAKQALSKAGDTAKFLSQKTGVPLPLATALIAAGMTGGPAAIPFAALLYFVKQPLMKGANKAFDATWDTGARAVQGVKNTLSGKQPVQKQTSYSSPGWAGNATESFRAFIEADSWGDWAGEKLGGAAGTIAGNVSGYGGKVASSISSRIKEIGQYAKNNPKEIARFAFLVGAGAAIGAGVGKITHEVQDFIVQKIKDQGIDPEVLDWAKHNIVLNKKGSGNNLSGKVNTSNTGHDVKHPSFIDPETGYEVSPEAKLATGGKMMKRFGAPDQEDIANIGGKGNILSKDGMGVGTTISNTSSAGTTNTTRISVPESPDLRDSYRDAAKVLQGEYKPGIFGGIFGGKAERGDAVDHMVNSSPTDLTRTIDLKPAGTALNHYGHSRSEEIAKRLAAAKAQFSPDNYTTPAAIAGGVVGGTGNKRR